MKSKGMDLLYELVKKDKSYLSVIKESAIVKNAVKLLSGGERRKTDEDERKEAEEREQGMEGRIEDEKGKEGIDCELKVMEKEKLLELLVELVKGGIVLDEEEIMEVALSLEEEANEHMEDGDREGEGEGDGGEAEENAGEKREWEELGERAHELVWVMEMMKKGREKKDMRKVIDWMETRKEEEAEKENSELKKNSIQMERENYQLSAEGRVLKEEMDGVKKDNEHLKELCPIITSLDDTSVTFPHGDGIKREGNTIIHQGSNSYLNCFLGGVMTSV